MKYNWFVVYFCGLVLFLVFPLVSAEAAIVPLDFGNIFSNTGTPANPPPWLKASFADVSPGVVELTISAVGLFDGEKIGEVYFNLDPALNPFQLMFSDPVKTGSFSNPTITHGTSSKPYDQYKADGDGKYDILIAFDTTTAGAFSNGESVKYTITLESLTANSFDFLSTSTGGSGPYLAASHIQDTSGITGNSAWVYAVHGNQIPEPATIGLLGLGVLALRKKK